MLRLFLLLSLPVALSGCGHGCNLMYAPDQLSILFNPPLSGEGEFLLEVEGDATGACVITLPDAAVCEGDLQVFSDATEVSGLQLYELAPAHLTVSVSKDGTLLSMQEVSPTYTVDEPNGKGCGERHSAEVELDPNGG